MNYRNWVAITLSILLTACASSPYKYHVEPTPLEKGKSTYYLGNVSVDLTIGNGGKENDERFASQQDLEQSFLTFLMEKMNEEGVLAQTPADADAILSVEIDYTRTFNHGGNALNKPRVSYTVSAFKDMELLASYSVDEFTTSYGGIKNALVNAQIAAFAWGAEDEPKDIELISELISEEISELGK